jgi:hypothetical protein
VTIVIVVPNIGIIGFMTTSASESNNTDSSGQNLTVNWMDVYGLGIYSAADTTNNNNNSLYLSTHNGLFKKRYRC